MISCLIVASGAAQVRVGPFLGYGDHSGLWGLGAYSEFLINDKVSVSPVFIQYFPEDLDRIPRRSMWELNGNVNYYIVNGEVGYLYGLAGLNYTRIKNKTRTLLTEDTDYDGNVGINVGLGAMVRINGLLLPFVEGKYTAGGYSQASLLFGVKFQFGDSTLEEDY